MFLQQGQNVALIGDTNSLMMINGAGKRILKFLLKIQQCLLLTISVIDLVPINTNFWVRFIKILAPNFTNR